MKEMVEHPRKFLLTLQLFLLFTISTAQVKVSSVSLQVGMGVGISNKPESMFGTPFFLTGEGGMTLSNGWRVSAEGGALEFRDAAWPDRKIGLIFSTYSRYQHRYIGVKIGHNLLSVRKNNELFLSTGADYLLVIDPNIKPGGFSILSFNYLYKKFVNIPLQLDYIITPSNQNTFRFVLSSRYNFNHYHSFPTFSVGASFQIVSRRGYRFKPGVINGLNER